MSLSNRVHVTEHFFIALGDGTRLAARLWLQEGADATPVPAILEYIPYRKRDGTRGRDEPMHPGSPRSASICGLYHGNWGLRGGQRRYRSRSRGLPVCHSFRSAQAQRSAGDQMTLKIEDVVSGGMHRDKALSSLPRTELL
jgi:hypothetical protein